MVTWDTVAVWGLQAIGAVGAIWGLFASETSKKVESTGQRRLTGRGWFALAGITLGLCGFALNQYKDKQRSDREKVRIEAEERRAEDIKRNGEVQLEHRRRDAEFARAQAKVAQNQLENVKLSQAGIALSQGSLIDSQRSQINFLTGLAMVQQQLSGIELSWPQGRTHSEKITKRIHSAMSEWQIEQSGNNAYFERCISSGDLIMTRRPNYAWKVTCRIFRPMGTLSLSFEVPAGDRRANVLDVFLDDLLSPNLLIHNSRGDILLESNIGSRPIRVERLSGNYRIELEVARTRFSTLADPDISIRMETQDLRALPKLIRIRSRDPLARFDTQFRPEWKIQTIGSLTMQLEAGEDPEQVDIKAAVAPVRGFRVSFDELLRPSGSRR